MAVSQYLSEHGCADSDSKLYNAGFVAFVRAAHSDDNKCIFVHGQCCAEMKKWVTYLSYVKLSQAGDIVEFERERAAGVGPSAYCEVCYSVCCA